MVTTASFTYPVLRLMIRIRNRLSLRYQKKVFMSALAILLVISVAITNFAHQDNIEIPSYEDYTIRGRNELQHSISSMRIFIGYSVHNEEESHRIHAMANDFSVNRIKLEMHTIEQQRALLVEHGEKCYPSDKFAVLKRYEELNIVTQAHYRHELWKYCALVVYGGAYIDKDSPLLKTYSDAFPLQSRNYAVIGSTIEKTIHGSVIILPEKNSPVALGMIKLIVDSGDSELDINPLLLQRKLYDLVSSDINMNAASRSLTPGIASGLQNEWVLLDQRCSFMRNDKSNGNIQTESYSPFECPPNKGYCCEIIEPENLSVVMITRYATFPIQYKMPFSLLQKPYAERLKQHSTNPNLPYISTIRETVLDRTETSQKSSFSTPNFYEILSEKECLPADKQCSTCLRNKSGANCVLCQKECSCYCDILCHEFPEPKFVKKHLHISLPPYKKDPSRFIPRIVHQTWFEDISAEKYPNMSRLIESWKQSGWEYRFYDDDAAADFLSTHFPPEVREAYDALIPGAFKADLFRYCALLINGGVYADMDVMLESNLDASIPNDVGFMVPMDEPGTPRNQRMCLWNGFLASAPGHPFLMTAIEIIVNNVRNRFTSVDIDSMLCPAPELSISHAFDTLFTAGPCALGSAVNLVLRRHLQTPYVPGDLDFNAEGSRANSHPTVLQSEDTRTQIPGRAIILNQNKSDMGAHRFTWLEKNLVLAATDLPDYDDREKLEGDEEQTHYSKTHVRIGIYGLEKLYEDNYMANEDIKFTIEESTSS